MIEFIIFVLVICYVVMLILSYLMKAFLLSAIFLIGAIIELWVMNKYDFL